MRRVRRWALAAVMLAGAASSNADKAYLEASCALDFPEAMSLLQDSIAREGYQVSRIQHVDRGLLDRGYETDEYKVVFFGTPEQMADVVARYPVLIPFVPLNITIGRDGDKSRISTLSPAQLGTLDLPSDTASLILQWQESVQRIVTRYATCRPDE